MQSILSGFLAKQRVATICCIDENNAPYCFNCFYAFEETRHLLLFKSGDDTLHMQLLAQNEKVSGTILPDKLQLLALKGIQFTGTFLGSHPPAALDLVQLYHKRHPLAVGRPGKVWAVQLEKLKLTDSTAIFGKKTYWEKTDYP